MRMDGETFKFPQTSHYATLGHESKGGVILQDDLGLTSLSS